INHALAISYRRNAYDDRAVFVAHVSLVKGVPFFGYRVGYRAFLKIYLLNPLHMTRLADLLHHGAVLGRAFQPYEAHLQYLAQWMCDFNLYGCAYVDCAKVAFRTPVPARAALTSSAHRWHDASIRPEWVTDAGALPRQSHCAIELDLRVEDILNRCEVRERQLHHNFLERFLQLGPDDKFVNSMAGLWRDETKRRKRRMGITDPSSSPFPPEVLVSMSADARASQKGGWIHEDEYREMIDGLVRAERESGAQGDVSFDNFVKPHEMEGEIQTALASLEDLFQRKLQPEGDDAVPEHLDGPVDLLGDAVDGDLDQDGLTADSDTGVLDMFDDIESDEEVARELALSQAPKKSSPRKSGGGPARLFVKSINRDSTTMGTRAGLEVSSGELAELERDLAWSEAPPNKKRRLDASPAKPSKFNSSPSKRVAFAGAGQAPASSQHSLNGNSSNEKLSQSSIKAFGSSPGTRAFPAVKNPHDPDTALRLSQRSEWSNSQKEAYAADAAKLNGSGEETPSSKLLTSSSEDANPISPRSVPSSQVLRLAGTYVSSRRAALFAQPAPSSKEIETTLLHHGLPPVIYQNAYYSDEKDVPERPREYAGREYRLESTTLPFLPDFDPSGASIATYGEKPGVVIDKGALELQGRRLRQRCSLRNWQYAHPPPTFEEVEAWQEEASQVKHEDDPDARVKNAPAGQKTFTRGGMSGGVRLGSQVEGPTQKHRDGAKYSQKQKGTSVQHETQYMSIMSLEVHVSTRGSLVPDPAEDAITAIFWCIEADDDHEKERLKSGILVLSESDETAARIAKQVSVPVEREDDELDLLNRMVDIVREYDPDILTGFEVHNTSWGYLIERARVKYEYNLCDEFSRMKAQSHGRFGKDADRWGFTHTSTIRVTGRHMINIWRAMRGELNLLQYTLENVVFHLLHKRVPHYSFADLTRWYLSDRPRDVAKTLSYFLTRIRLNLDILKANELIERTSEQARLLGVDFFSVFSRGSQFKVESLMFRIAKPENFILVSPSRKQVGQQNALECLPLVMEPQSAFYNSPLLILDFQSLYPSVMIAYNYCYSTCLGRIVPWRGTNKLGFSEFQREPRLLELVKDHVNVAPNGLMFVRPELRKSLLAKMLGEILETRVMVKSGMKVDRDDRSLQQLLNNRQLALKLIANVTYGYTSASFSGRMPCSEIADSIVQTGRETLEKAIALIHSVTKWGAEVVYGDTDSLFVYLKGRTRDEAFKIGDEIAEAVTKTNPRPVKLKFEKVYHPCVLLAKKRYVGFKYESPSQKEPEFDAKGIETVRRDGTPAEQKIEEKALKILFRSQDLSEVKRYFQAQCTKIMRGKVSVQDFLFAKEVKLGSYSDKGPPPPGALIATR
ncbi:MAG: hypothetical protein INR71_02645, partial [Terriglobus roseus]|nr:hypothetical protein [Terriglobus roseus]